jgi:hypothetical protein
VVVEDTEADDAPAEMANAIDAVETVFPITVVPLQRTRPQILLIGRRKEESAHVQKHHDQAGLRTRREE